MDETALDVFSNWPSNKWVTAGGKRQDHTSSFGSSAYKVHKNTMGPMYPPICTHSLVMMMLTYFIIILYYCTYQQEAIKTLMISNDFPYNVENMKQIKSHKTNSAIVVVL